MEGYRWLHLQAIQMGFVVQQDTIQQILKLVNDQGVGQLRRAQQFFSRKITSFFLTNVRL